LSVRRAPGFPISLLRLPERCATAEATREVSEARSTCTAFDIQLALVTRRDRCNTRLAAPLPANEIYSGSARVTSSADQSGGPTEVSHNPSVGELSGDPAATAVAQASGLASWLSEPHELSATGDRAASRLGQLSWAVFEWARNPYVLLVTIYLFAPYFSRTVVGDPVRGQALWGAIAATGGLIVAALAPFLGAIADAGGRRKPWIAFYVVILVTGSMLMWFAKPHSTGWDLVFVGALVACSNVAFEFSAVFHNSLLPTIAQPRNVAGLSGLGLALTNAAGVILLSIMLFCFALPGKIGWSFLPAEPLFGLSHALHEPERLAGPASALWLLVFCIPLFLFTPDRPKGKVRLFAAAIAGVKSVIGTVRSLRSYRNVAAYLVARLFFNDGMTAVLTFGGIYAATTFNWGPPQILIYGIELSIFAVLGGFLGGFLDNRFGSKRAIFISIGGTALAGIASLTMAPDRILWFVHVDVHAPPVWSLPYFNTWPELVFLGIVNFTAVLITAGYANSRTMLARIAPTDKMTEFFGLYSLSGTSTTFLATGFVSWLTAVSQSQRIGLLGETAFLLTGLVLMLFVKEERAQAV
jgi:MFS transporter, UMF1 family